MGTHVYTSLAHEREALNPEDHISQVRTNSLLVFARNLLIGVLCGLIAFGLYHMSKSFHFAGRLNY